MFKRMSGVKWLILNCVTFGIYTIVMWCRMTKNFNKMAEMNGQKGTMGYIPACLLGCVTFGIVPFIWTIKFYRLMASLNRAKDAGVSPSNGFLMFIMSYIPIYSFFWMAKANNKLIDAYEAVAE